VEEGTVHSKQFKYEVMSKFAPEYAAAPLRELKESWYACVAVALFGTALLYFVVMPGTLSEGNADRTNPRISRPT
jgi:hypothetical protein